MTATVAVELREFPRKALKVADLQVGQKFVRVRTATWWRVLLTALSTGDFNLIHMSQRFARHVFKKDRRVAHGVLQAGFISSAASMLFGDGCVASDVHIRFPKPVFVGDRVEIVIEVSELPAGPSKPVVASFTLRNLTDKKLCAKGTISVFLPRV